MAYSDILRQFTSLLHYPVELRVINAREGSRKLGTVSGYFNDPDLLADACEYWSGKAPAVYCTLNPVQDDLLARANNRWETFARSTTADDDVVHRDWLPIDCDAIRPSGISSTHAEHEAALDTVRRIVDELREHGFPACLVGDSGNGGHALFRIDEPNSPKVAETIKAFLEALALRFDSPAVKVDTGVFNAARIWKVYGTKACKGDEVGDRVHRYATILECPDELPVVSMALVQSYIAKYGQQQTTKAEQGSTPDKQADSKPNPQKVAKAIAWVERFIERHDITVNLRKTDQQGRQVFRLERCPFCLESDKAAVLTVAANGKRGFKCQHNRCVGKAWKDFRKHYEPDYYGGSEQGSELPTILCNARQPSALFADARNALIKANDPPCLFIRGGTITRLRTDPENGQPFFQPLNDGGLLEVLAESANWKKRSNETATACNIPDCVVRYFKGNPDCGLPVVKSILETPVFIADGQLIDKPGYHATAKVYLQPSRLALPAIPTDPTQQQIQAAKDLILVELLGDFPFADEASRANALALLLTVFVRLLIDGPTPLFDLDASTAGTGKGLLIRLFVIIWTGRIEAAMAAPTNEEEWQKRITSTLLQGPVYILWDNINCALNSASLAMALTSRTVRDRLLGGNTIRELPNDCLWIATANNLRASNELTRRIVRVRLDANMERPHERSGWRHERIAEWATANRSELVAAALTLCQAWIAKGRPLGNVSMGSYESWAAIVGGILDTIGVDGFLANKDQLATEINTADTEWRDFVKAWAAAYTDSVVDVGQLMGLVDDQGLLPLVLASADNRRVMLGRALSGAVGRVFSGWKISRFAMDAHRKANRYCLQAIEPKGQPDANDTDCGSDSGSEADQAMPCPVGSDRTGPYVPLIQVDGPQSWRWRQDLN